MKTFINLLLLIITISKQLNAQQNSLDTIVKDFNKDKINDVLINDFSSGSSTASRIITIIDGKTNEEFSLTNEGDFSSFLNVITIPENLTLKENDIFLEAIKEKILPKKRDSIDSSLKWLLSGALSLKRLDTHPFFNLIAYPKTRWKTNFFDIPERYYINISGDTLRKLDGINDSSLKGKKAKESKGFLLYFTGHYFPRKIEDATFVTKNKEYEIYKTNHVVFAKKGDTYKWVFISDNAVAGAPGKHGWNAIGKMQLLGKYLIIHHNVPPDPIYNIQIINIETQKVGRLKFESSYKNSYKNMNTYEIKEDSLIFGEIDSPDEAKEISLKKIFNALDSY